MRHREGEEREKADENSVEEGRPVSVHLLGPRHGRPLSLYSCK